jgi:hypothetical protein
MNIEYLIETKENELHVTVVMPHIDNPLWLGGHVRIVNEDVEAYLDSNKIEHGPCKTYMVGYNSNHDARKRTWIFSLPEKSEVVEKPKTKKATRTRKSRATKSLKTKTQKEE